MICDGVSLEELISVKLNTGKALISDKFLILKSFKELNFSRIDSSAHGPEPENAEITISIVFILARD